MGWHSKPLGDGIRRRGGVGDLPEVIRTCGWGPHGQISTLIEATPAETSLAPFPMCPRSQEPAPYNLKAGPHQIPNLPTSWSRTSHPSRTVRNQLLLFTSHSAAAAKSLQSCPTLCDPIDGSPAGSLVPGILQARTLEWVAISFSNAWKWKVKVKSLSHIRLLATPWTATYQAPLSMGYSRQEYWSGVPLSSLTLSKHIYIIIPESTSLETTNLNLQAQIEKQWLKGTYA